MDVGLITAAYKYVAIVSMLAQMQDSGAALALPGSLPVSDKEIRLAYVSHPLLSGFGGAIDTSDYAFGFSTNGLWSITRINQSPNMHVWDLHKKLEKMKSLIDTNDCYPMAKQWLIAMQVDVPALEKSFHPIVRQTIITWDPQRPPSVPLPVFDVFWGSELRPAVRVTILGPTKGLVRLHVENRSFIKGSNSLVMDVEKLLAIPDEEFPQYTYQQRTNLLARHTGITSTNLPAWDAIAFKFAGQRPRGPALPQSPAPPPPNPAKAKRLQPTKPKP